MSPPQKASAALYYYDPVDRLTRTLASQRFYNGTRLATEINGERKTSFFEHESMPLAEVQLAAAGTLLATDFQASVLHSINSTHHQPQAYSPYGHRPAENGLLSVLGFNGERPDPVTGHYLLGQGHRAYNPVLMRFNSPDTLSPFGKGGINAYAYCSNNPITRVDPTGESWVTKIFKNYFETMDNLSKKGLPNSDEHINKHLLDNALTKYDPPKKIAKTERYIKQINTLIEYRTVAQETIQRSINYLPTSPLDNGVIIKEIQRFTPQLQSINAEIKHLNSHLDLTKKYLQALKSTPADISEAVTGFRSA